MTEIRNVDLAILADYRAGQVAACEPPLFCGNLRSDASGARTEPDGPAPFAPLYQPDGDAGRAEQAGACFGDLLQRPLSLTRRTRDRAQDFGAGGLPVPRGAKLAFQARGYRSGFGDGLTGLGSTGLEFS